MSTRIDPGPLHSFSLYAALLLSGASALIYESTWGRMLHHVFGVSDLAVATVLAAFFLGLGLGSALGGWLAPRLRRHALAYAALEAGVGLCALISLLVIPGVHDLYTWVGSSASFFWLSLIRFLLALSILLPPTILMGATLPILVALIARHGQNWSARATWLYASNTAGAVLGAGAAGLWLVPTYGARVSILLAAAGSVAAGLIVIVVWRRQAPQAHVATAENGATHAAPPPLAADISPHPDAVGVAQSSGFADPGGRLVSSTPVAAVVLACLSGFAALAGEVLWTRLLRIVVHGTTQAFAAMLINYLSGIAIGSALANRWARRVASPERAFGLAQMAAAALGVLSLLITPQLPRILCLLRGSTDLDPHETWVVLVLSAILLLPLAIAIGAGIPLAWRMADRAGGEAGSHSGRILAANTLGGLFGALAAGFVLVPALGLEASLLCVLFVNLTTAALAFRFAGAPTPGRRLAWVCAPLVLAVVFYALQPRLPLSFLLHARQNPESAILYGARPEWEQNLIFLEEGRNTTVTLMQRDTEMLLYNDGLPESGLSARNPGFGPEQALLGGLPTLFAENRERAMVIGLGAGHTATVLLAGPWARVDVVELESAVVRAARAMHERFGKPFPLDDPRTRLTIDDARAQLTLAPAGSYDTVVSQPSHPWLAGSSALYTREFFQDVRRALRPGGVFSLWVNLFRMDLPHLQQVVATLRGVFPCVRGFIIEMSSLLLCASLEPRKWDSRTDLRFSTDSGLLPFLEPYGVHTLADLAATVEIDEPWAEAFGAGLSPISDDRPALEFDLARLPNAQLLNPGDLDGLTRRFPWIAPATYADLPEPVRLPALLARIKRVGARRLSLTRIVGTLDALGLPEADRLLIEGALAEAVGDPKTACERYDRAGSPIAAERADRLRLLLGKYAEALEVAGRRKSPPTRAEALLRCAAGLQTPEAARSALQALGASIGPDELGAPGRVLAAFATGKASAVLALETTALQAAGDSPEFAFLVERCALEANDLSLARKAADMRTRRLGIEASRAADYGVECLRYDNLGAAEMHLRRALETSPTHAQAAGVLARVLHKRSRPEEARQVLLNGLEACKGLPSQGSILVQVAVDLGLDLGTIDAGS